MTPTNDAAKCELCGEPMPHDDDEDLSGICHFTIGQLRRALNKMEKADDAERTS